MTMKIKLIAGHCCLILTQNALHRLLKSDSVVLLVHSYDTQMENGYYLNTRTKTMPGMIKYKTTALP